MERRTNRIDDWTQSWVDRYFDLPLWTRALLIGVLAALLGFALDEMARSFGYPWFFERLFENLVEGAVIALVVFWLSVLREKRMVRRMKEIGFLNHHIRNAVYTIELAATGISDSQKRAAVIHESVSRVVEVLCRISRQDDELGVKRRAEPAVAAMPPKQAI